MRKAKKILITTVTHEVLVVRRGRTKTTRGFCPPCGAETEMLELNQAATVSGMRLRELIREIENKSFHSTEDANGRLLICAESLREAAARTRNNDI
jgi:hypothetical protein